MIILGTAGHVDHGKTTLVRQLTGFETDRHPEEKKRGVSIDIAVAPFELEAGVVCGIVDLPGHEDFIKNMLAGVSSIDLLLLIVACDDSVMPQTLEHLKIAKLLDVKSLFIVMTKTDLVQPDVIELAHDEVKELVAKIGYKNSKSFLTSSINGTGINELKNAIIEFSTGFKRKEDSRAFRMFVRHNFKAKGFGSIVTGIPSSGTINQNDEIECEEGRFSVRSIQVYRKDEQSAGLGKSVALNIRDLPDLERGTVISAPGIFQETLNCLAVVSNSSAEILAKRGGYRFHVGTAVINCSVKLVDSDSLEPNHSCVATIRLDRKSKLAAGDRFILRSQNGETIGGGRLLSVNLKKINRFTDDLLERLINAQDALKNDNYLLSELYSGKDILYPKEKLITVNQGSVDILARLDELRTLNLIKTLKGGCYIFLPRINEIERIVVRVMERYHKQNKLVTGAKIEYLSALFKIPNNTCEELIYLLIQRGAIALKHGRVALKDFEPEISPRSSKLRDELLKHLTKAGIQTIARGDVRDLLKIEETEFRQIIKLSVDLQEVITLGNNLILKDIYETAKANLLKCFDNFEIVELSQFREASGLSRNAVTLILDGLDSEGLTKRVEGGRILVRRKNE